MIVSMMESDEVPWGTRAPVDFYRDGEREYTATMRLLPYYYLCGPGRGRDGEQAMLILDPDGPGFGWPLVAVYRLALDDRTGRWEYIYDHPKCLDKGDITPDQPHEV